MSKSYTPPTPATDGAIAEMFHDKLNRSVNTSPNEKIFGVVEEKKLHIALGKNQPLWLQKVSVPAALKH